MSSCPTRLLGIAQPSSGIETSNIRRSHMSDEASVGLGQPGTTIANYEVINQIGEGGMGRVFEVWHPQLRKSFALKLLVEQLEHDATAIDRFQSETLALGQLDHVNIVSAIDAGTWQGRPFLVTQFLQGTDLATHVAHHGPLDLEQLSGFALQILRGMQAAHAVGLYHRDIKPSNLFLETSGTIKLLDFGLVRSNTCESSTKTGCLMGSVDFLSPEQAQDPRSADARSDIYSLGCTFIFLLSGSAPFPDESYPSLPGKLLAHSHQSPPWLERALACDPHPLLRLIQRMVAKQPNVRPQSAQEIISDWEAIIANGRGADSLGSTSRRWKPNFHVATGMVIAVLLVPIAAILLRGWGAVGNAPRAARPLMNLRAAAPAMVSPTLRENSEPEAKDREISVREPTPRKTLTTDETRSAHVPMFPSGLTGPPRSTSRENSRKFGSARD